MLGDELYDERGMVKPKLGPDYSDVLKEYEKALDVGEINASDEEKVFIREYLKHGNGVAAHRVAFADRTWLKESSRSTAATMLVKKFKLKGKSLKTIRANGHATKSPGDMIRFVKEKYLAGEISEQDLLDSIKDLKDHSTQDTVRLAAIKEMKEWYREARSEFEANKLAMQDIVPLMADALSHLPREKYVAVLKDCRRRRLKDIYARTIVYDADKVRKAEIEKIKSQGGRVYEPDLQPTPA